jgi:hypothetical protein
MVEDKRSIQELFSAAFAQVGQLVRIELQLARAEIAQSGVNAGFAIGLLAAGGAVGISAVVMFLLAVSSWLARPGGLDEPAAHLLSAIIGAALAGAFAWAGMVRLRALRGLPRTAEQIERDAAVVKETLK